MLSMLQQFRAGQVRFPAVPEAPEVMTGGSGRLWRWTGEGTPFVTLQVATRETIAPDEDGVRGHLTREIGQVEERLTEVEVSDVEVAVAGACAARAAYVDGTSGVAPLRHGLLVCTDGEEFMHVVHVVVVRITEGIELVDEVLGAVSIDPEAARL